MPKFHAERSLRAFRFRYFAFSHASNSWSMMLDRSGDSTPPCGTPSLDAVNRPRSRWPAFRICQSRSQTVRPAPVVARIAEATGGERCRTSIRQTIYRHPLPEQVTVLRSSHALDGKVLPVLGRRKRAGRLHLLLGPPNSDPILIPAEWTDFAGGDHPPHLENDAAPESNQCLHLGSVANLRQLRTVVDGLLRCPSGSGVDTQQSTGTEGRQCNCP